MERGSGGRGQGINPDVPKTPDTQPDQTAIAKRERKREADRRWRAQHPERAAELSRRSSLKYIHEHPDKARESNRKWAEKHPEKAKEVSRKSSNKYNEKKRTQTKEKGKERGETVIFTEKDYSKSESAQDSATAPKNAS